MIDMRPFPSRLCAMMLLSILGLATMADAATAHDSALMTAEQVSANEMLTRLNRDPAVQAVQARLAERLATAPPAATPDGKARIGHAIAGWTNTLILREIAADPAAPSILWLCDDTPMDWHGMHIPHRSSSLMNPDRIYRGALFDGAGHYEIVGEIDPQHRPEEFSFEVTRGTAGLIMMTTANATTADLGDQVSIVTSRDLDIDARGRFRITIGPEAGGRNHLHTPAAPIAMTLRDALSNWSQRPNKLSLRRLDATDAQPLSYEQLRGRLLADLPDWVDFFTDYPRSWLGGLENNQLRGPVPRDGGWGYLAAGRYHLAPGEALVIVTTRQSAHYTGVQVTDPWLIGPSGIDHQTSLNNSQVFTRDDGSVVYVVSPEDPGVTNWIDSGGLRDGFVILRWEAMAQRGSAEGLVREVRTMKMSELGSLDLPAVSPEQRRRQMAERAKSYNQRLR